MVREALKRHLKKEGRQPGMISSWVVLEATPIVPPSIPDSAEVKRLGHFKIINSQHRMKAPIAYADLLAAQTLAYRPCDFGYTDLQPEAESLDYGACTLVLNGLRVRYRVAKTTPTKVGQFVTLWKRVDHGFIQPFDASDPIDAFIVSSRSGPHFGQFVFPKAVLVAQGVMAINSQGGKRAMRVYPPWDTTTSRQAQRTQAWQQAYFLDMSDGRLVDLGRARALLTL